MPKDAPKQDAELETRVLSESERFKIELDGLLKRYPNIRLNINQTIQITEVPSSTPIN